MSCKLYSEWLLYQQLFHKYVYLLLRYIRMDLFDVYTINPINIAKASGSLLWDSVGNEYLDMYGGHAVISIGHTHPRYVQRLSDQLNKVGFYSNSVQIPLQQELANLLGKISGKMDYQLFLCNSGAEANENAIKLASFHNGRKKIVAFSDGFHGRTSLAVAATSIPKIIAPINETDNVIFLPFNDVTALEEVFAARGSEISSVITEGIQGIGGIREATPEFLQAIKRLTVKHGSVFIADAVQCGYGRSGKFFSTDHANVDADIYTMAKGMGNGFPIGGLAIAPPIKASKGLLGTTFGGNHLACAAAIAVLEIIEEDNLIPRAGELGDYLIGELRKLDHSLVIRGRGLMIGIDLPSELAHVRKELLTKHRIFTGEAAPHVIRLLPALNLSKAHADRFLEAFDQVINHAYSTNKV